MHCLLGGGLLLLQVGTTNRRTGLMVRSRPDRMPGKYERQSHRHSG